MTPESITPLERHLPYLLLISFSSIQFRGCILLLFFTKVNSFLFYFYVFFKFVIIGNNSKQKTTFRLLIYKILLKKHSISQNRYHPFRRQTSLQTPLHTSKSVIDNPSPPRHITSPFLAIHFPFTVITCKHPSPPPKQTNPN